MDSEKLSKQLKESQKNDIDMKFYQSDNDFKKFKSHDAFFIPNKNLKRNNTKTKASNGNDIIKINEKRNDNLELTTKKELKDLNNKIKSIEIIGNLNLSNQEKKIEIKNNQPIKKSFKEIKYREINQLISRNKKRNIKRFNKILNKKSIQELGSEDSDNNALNKKTLNNEKNHLSKNNFSLYTITNTNIKSILNKKFKKRNNYDISNDKKKKNEINRNLLMYAKKGDKEKVLELLNNNSIDINFQNENGWSALHFACEEGNLKIVDILIKAKINVNLLTFEKKTALHLSAKKGYFDISKLLIENDADIMCLDNEKNLPIHLCSMEGHNELLNYLLEKNNKCINYKNIYGKSILDLATKKETKLIVEKFIKLNEKNKEEINNNLNKKSINEDDKKLQTEIINNINNNNNNNKLSFKDRYYSLIKIQKNNKNNIQFLMMPSDISDNNNKKMNSSLNEIYPLQKKISINNIKSNKIKESNSKNNNNTKKNKNNISYSSKRKRILNINITNNYISYLLPQENLFRFSTLSNMSSSRRKKYKIYNNNTYSNYYYSNKIIDVDLTSLKGNDIFCDSNTFGKMNNINNINNKKSQNLYFYKNYIKKDNNFLSVIKQNSVNNKSSKLLNLSTPRTISKQKFSNNKKMLNKKFPLYLKKILKKNVNCKNKKKIVIDKYIENKNRKKMICNEDEATLIDDLDEEIDVKPKNTSKNEEKNVNSSDKESKIGPNSFLCLALLGQGSYGEVYLVRQKNTSKYYAMKVLDKFCIENQNFFKYVYTEKNILSSINCPFIVKLYYSFQTNEKLFLIMDYCSGGDLSKQIHAQKRFSEDVAKFYICEIILALGELHKRDIIYRDLKPDNLVLDKNGHILLTDFGLSREGVYDKDIAKSFCGSIAYLAPEMLNRNGYGKAIDWYLLGVLLYEMLVGFPPFLASTHQEIFNNIINSELYIPSFISKKAQKFIKLLMKKNPEERLGAKRDMEEIKENEYFSDIDWEKVYNKKYKTPKIVSDSQKLEYFKEPILFTENYDIIDDEQNDLFVKDINISDENEKINDKFKKTIIENKYKGWSFVKN